MLVALALWSTRVSESKPWPGLAGVSFPRTSMVTELTRLLERASSSRAVGTALAYCAWRVPLVVLEARALSIVKVATWGESRRELSGVNATVRAFASNSHTPSFGTRMAFPSAEMLVPAGMSWSLKANVEGWTLREPSSGVNIAACPHFTAV